MKRFFILSLLALFSLGLAVACGGGSSGPSCEDVCTKVSECDSTEDYNECLSMCDMFKEVMRDEAYQALGDCTMEQTCAFMEENGDYCFEAAMAEGSLTAARSLIERICTTMAACDTTGNYTQQQCVDDMTSGENDDLDSAMSIFKDSVLDCVADCVENESCTDLAEGSAQDCMTTCGLVVFSSDFSGPTCEDVCNKMVECGLDTDMTECLSGCAPFEDSLRPEVFTELGDCFMENTCETLNADEDGDMCFRQAMTQGSTTAGAALVDDLCVKYVECDDSGTLTQEDCVSQFTAEQEGAIAQIGMFKDSVLDCFVDCINGLTCAEAADDNSMDACSQDCGLFID
ncbi:MAG: hypothetical protein JRF33_09160 [Deltaproteobacteria bacterium]|nr:hypothetical protein [Deltaproteobacteria bacterium]